MPATRTTLDLKQTTIHDHLLKNKKTSHSTMNHSSENKTSDIKHSPSLSTTTTYHASEITARNEDDRTLLKSSIDYQKSILTTNNSQQALSSSEMILPPISQATEIPMFSGDKTEDPGQWVDQVLTFMEQQNINPSEQRDVAARKLCGEALLWYRMNRLQIPDIQTFIHQFLLVFNSSHTATSKDISSTHASSEETIVEKMVDRKQSNKCKSSTESSGNRESLFRCESPWHVIQSAKNERVKLIQNFSGSDNSFNWIKNLEQTAKALKLKYEQIYELATIKLSGPAQEWYYNQDDDIFNWTSFKQVLLRAFPSPIQPTNIT